MPAATTSKRLTWSEIKECYPHQWIGISGVETAGNNRATVTSAIVFYTGIDKTELEMLQFDTDGEIRAVYTTPDDDAYISSVRF